MDPLYYPRYDHVRVVIFWDEVAWVAIGLEFHICGQGDNVDAALSDWRRTFDGEIRLREQFKEAMEDHIMKAPDTYWERFEASREYQTLLCEDENVRTLEVRVEP